MGMGGIVCALAHSYSRHARTLTHIPPSSSLNFVGVRSGKVVEGITYIPDVWYGGRGGKQLGAYNGIGCPLVGFSAYTDTLVNQLTFKFSCEMNVPAVKSGQLYGKDEGDRHEQTSMCEVVEGGSLCYGV